MLRRRAVSFRLPAALVALAVAAVGAAACTPAGAQQNPGWAIATPAGSGGAPGATPAAQAATVVPVIISGEQVLGANRFVFSFLDAKTNLPAAGPDRTVSVAFIAPGETQPGTAVPAEFVWAIEGSRGEYVARTDFPAAGDWRAIFVTQAPNGPKEAIGIQFKVLEHGTTVAVGDKAPASRTLTLADVGGDVRQISTDAKPDPDFYRTSVADAVAAGKPFVLVFATPAFCQSAQCGPTLDRVKKVKAAAPADVEFINVEPYQLASTDGRLQPVLDAKGQLQSVPAVDEWKILTEPWIFTVDGGGIVRGSFEGVASEQELGDAVKAISGT